MDDVSGVNKASLIMMHPLVDGWTVWSNGGIIVKLYKTAFSEWIFKKWLKLHLPTAHPRAYVVYSRLEMSLFALKVCDAHARNMWNYNYLRCAVALVLISFHWVVLHLKVIPLVLLDEQYGVNVKHQEYFADNPSTGMDPASKEEWAEVEVVQHDQVHLFVICFWHCWCSSWLLTPCIPFVIWEDN